MEYFFAHVENIPEGIGYGQFTPTHFTLIAIALILVAVIFRVYRMSGEKQRLVIRRAIALTLIAAEVIKFSVMAYIGVDITIYLPLEICSFAVWAIVYDAARYRSRSVHGILMYIFFPAALMALLFPSTTESPALNFFSIYQFLFHALIIAYVISRFLCGELKTGYTEVWPSIGKTCILAGAVYIVDCVFDRNFMFLRDNDNNSMLMIISGVTGEGLPYTLGLVVFVVIVIHIFFVIFKIAERLVVRNAGT